MLIESLVFAGGVIVGSVVTTILINLLMCGTIRVDNSDQDGPLLFLELNKNIKTVSSKKHVMFKVKVEDYVSNK